ncbi:MAG: hypothetical protein GY838_06205 [bacterium]|nr:hypothetical protein [bacterium]
MAEIATTAVRTCRLLYYGATGVGKRENLSLIHRTIPPESQLSLAVEDPERQIAFRFNQPEGDSWQVLVQAIDAGRERPRAAGMVERPPFDAVVFAVDSGAAHLDQSLSAFEALKNYLDSWGRDLLEVPVVLQYNRRAASDALPVDRLESLLNPWGLLSFPADSAKGEGVRETLKSILGLAINHLKAQPEPEPEPAPAAKEASPTPPQPAAAPPEPVVEPVENMGLDYGPPVPGNEVTAAAAERGDAILDELRPPVVIPVKIPRRLLEGDRPVRILLEARIVDDDEAY